MCTQIAALLSYCVPNRTEGLEGHSQVASAAGGEPLEDEACPKV
jgi:hypothetical protein